MIVDAKKIFQEQLALSLGLKKYEFIMRRFRQVDVHTDVDFQTTFNAFYIVRRDADWRNKYYELFEQGKNNPLTFKGIIEAMYEASGNVEASFSSKMYATLYPDRPLWDQYILKNIGMKLEGKSQQDKLRNAIILYEEIEEWYSRYLMTDNAMECIDTFNQLLPSYSWISNIKKIDFLLWSIR